MVHCYPALSPLFSEAKEAMKDICIFLRIRTETHNSQGLMPNKPLVSDARSAA
jgi:hypothetical protein